jgi:PAS domain-containing protein
MSIYKYWVIILWIFDGIQLLSLPLSPNRTLPWYKSSVMSAFHQFLGAVAFLANHGVYRADGLYYAAAAVSFVILCLFGWTLAAADGSVTYAPQWRLKLLRMMFRICILGFTVPIFAALMSPFHCKTDEMWQDTGYLCWMGPHLAIAVSAFIILPLTVIAFVAFSLLAVDRTPDVTKDGKHNLLGSPSGRVVTMVFLIKAGVAGYFGVTAEGSPWARCVVYLIVGLLLLGQQVYFLPYYIQWLNQIQAAVFSIFLSGAVALALSLVVDSPTSTDNTGAVVCFFIIPLAAYCGASLATFRFSSLKTMTDLNSPTLVELKARYIIAQDGEEFAEVSVSGYNSARNAAAAAAAAAAQNSTAIVAGTAHRNSSIDHMPLLGGDGHRANSLAVGGAVGGTVDQLLLQQQQTVNNSTSIANDFTSRIDVKLSHSMERADRLYREAAVAFPTSAFMHLLVGQFLGVMRKNRHLERIHLRLASSCADQSAFDLHFFSYQRNKLLQNNDDTKTTKMTVEKRMTYERLLANARIQVMAARNLVFSFWNTLSEKSPDLTRMQNIGLNINVALSGADSVFKELLVLAPQSVTAMRAYAEFLLELANDPNKAIQLLQDAESLEDEQSRALVKSTDQDVIFGKEIEFDLSAHDLSLIRVSAHMDSVGSIAGANAAALKLFGYNRREIIGRDIAIIVPEPIASIHTLFIDKFQTTGIERVTGRSAQSFGLHRNNYIMPIRMNIWSSGDSWTAVIEEIITTLSFAFFSGPETGWKMHACCKSLASMLNIDLGAVKAGSVSAAHFIADIRSSMGELQEGRDEGVVLRLVPFHTDGGSGINDVGEFASEIAVVGRVQTLKLTFMAAPLYIARFKRATKKQARRRFGAAVAPKKAVKLGGNDSNPASVRTKTPESNTDDSEAEDKAPNTGRSRTRSESSFSGGESVDSNVVNRDENSDSEREMRRSVATRDYSVAGASHLSGPGEGSPRFGHDDHTRSESKGSPRSYPNRLMKADSGSVTRSTPKTDMPYRSSSSVDMGTKDPSNDHGNGSSTFLKGIKAKGNQIVPLLPAKAGEDEKNSFKRDILGTSKKFIAKTLSRRSNNSKTRSAQKMVAGMKGDDSVEFGPNGSILKAGSIASSRHSAGAGSNSSGTSVSEILRRGVLARSAQLEKSLVALRRSIIAVFVLTAIANIAALLVTNTLFQQLTNNILLVSKNGDRGVYLQRTYAAAQRLVLQAEGKYFIADGGNATRARMLTDLQAFDSYHQDLYLAVDSQLPEELALYTQPNVPVYDLVPGSYVDRDTYETTNRSMNLVNAGLEFLAKSRRLALLGRGISSPSSWSTNSLAYNQIEEASVNGFRVAMDDPIVFWILVNGFAGIRDAFNRSMLIANDRSALQANMISLVDLLILLIAVSLFVTIGACVMVPAVLRVISAKQTIFDVFLEVPRDVIGALRNRTLKKIEAVRQAQEDAAIGIDIAGRGDEFDVEQGTVAGGSSFLHGDTDGQSAIRPMVTTTHQTQGRLEVGAKAPVQGKGTENARMEEGPAAGVGAGAGKDAQSLSSNLSSALNKMTVSNEKKRAAVDDDDDDAKQDCDEKCAACFASIMFKCGFGASAETLLARKARKYRKATSVRLTMTLAMIWPVLIYVAYFIGTYFWKEDVVQFSRYAKSEVLWSRQAQFFISQLNFCARNAYGYDEPRVVQDGIDCVRSNSVLLSALQDALLYGDTHRDLRPGLQVSKNTFKLFMQDGCVENGDYWYKMEDCKSKFFSGLVGRGLMSAFKEYLQVLDRMMYKRSLDLLSSNLTVADMDGGDALLAESFAETYLSEGFHIASSYREKESLGTIAQFISLYIVATILSTAALVGFWLFLYLPMIRRLDKEIKHVRLLLLLFPDEVSRTVPAIVMAGREMLKDTASVGLSVSVLHT